MASRAGSSSGGQTSGTRGQRRARNSSDRSSRLSSALPVGGEHRDHRAAGEGAGADGAADGPGGSRADRPPDPVPGRGRDRAGQRADGGGRDVPAAVALPAAELLFPAAAGLAGPSHRLVHAHVGEHRGQRVVREPQRVRPGLGGAPGRERDVQDQVPAVHQGPQQDPFGQVLGLGVDLARPRQRRAAVVPGDEPGPGHLVQDRVDADREVPRPVHAGRGPGRRPCPRRAGRPR